MKNLILATFVTVALSACAQFHKKSENGTAPSQTTTTPTATPVAATKAQAVLKPSINSKVKGIVHFSEDGDAVKIETMVEGLKPGPHGFHIHEVGDCSKADFSSAGGHFNPGHGNHGALDSKDAKKRHAGDLGNLMADTKGKANAIIIVDGLTVKPGPHSILGKAIIIHNDKDDLKSQPAGNSGPRAACGVIEAL